VDLVYGAGELDRTVADVEALVGRWQEDERDWGQLYLEYEPVTPRDRVLVEDLAVTMLVNSRVAAGAATAVCRNAVELDLAALPDVALENTTSAERDEVAAVIATMTSWPWIGASLATKTLHKKRSALIPILDNQAIFGAYMNPEWPERRSLQETIKSEVRIREALEWVALDLTRPENRSVWPALEAIEPDRSRIEIFDMVWWMYFRLIEPAPGQVSR
jgi:Family of unknown function (DUF6308)